MGNCEGSITLRKKKKSGPPGSRSAGRRQATVGAVDPESESDLDSRAPAGDRGRKLGQPEFDSEVLCPGCKRVFPSLFSLKCHRNNRYMRSTACGRSLLVARPWRQRLSLRPNQATGAAADDSDWTDPDIRDMMGAGNSHDLPAGAGRREALPSRDSLRVSVPHP
jgi:hypothetical protein